MAIYGGCTGSLYAFSIFLPTIIKELGIARSAAEITLLSVPQYAAAALLTILMGLYADKSNIRGTYNIGVSLISITGFSMLLGSKQPRVKYAGTFLATLGIYPTVP
jgi:sugar phosphate permease